MARWAVVALVLCVVGCGYRVTGRGAAGSGGALWVAPVEDDAAEPLFGVILGRHLARQAVNRAGLVLSSQARAERELRVWVERVEERGAAFVVGDRTREYVLTATLRAVLAGPDGEVLWTGTGIRADREFDSGADVDHTERNKDAARELLAEDLARAVLTRVEVVVAGLTP